VSRRATHPTAAAPAEGVPGPAGSGLPPRWLLHGAAGKGGGKVKET